MNARALLYAGALVGLTACADSATGPEISAGLAPTLTAVTTTGTTPTGPGWTWEVKKEFVAAHGDGPGMPLLTPPYVIKPGETIWFEFAITSTRREGGIEGWRALFQERGQDVCATAGTGVLCTSSFLGGETVAPLTQWYEFHPAGAVSSGVTTVVIDIKNVSLPCGATRTLTNTVLMTPELYTGGLSTRTVPASASVTFSSPACASPPPPPPPKCTLTQGYWKNHEGAWPVSTLTLGTVTYTKAQLLAILRTPVKGNGLVSLAHQLIAAKLNGGMNDPAIKAVILQADALIGSRVIPPAGSGSLSTSATTSLVDALDAYNNGKTGPGHCHK